MGLPLSGSHGELRVSSYECDQLFTWPTDQPRHAAYASISTVETNSPPFVKDPCKEILSHPCIIAFPARDGQAGSVVRKAGEKRHESVAPRADSAKLSTVLIHLAPLRFHSP